MEVMMSAFKERLALEEREFNYHQMGPRFPLQDVLEEENETSTEDSSLE
jgi:hypothetical protein